MCGLGGDVTAAGHLLRTTSSCGDSSAAVCGGSSVPGAMAAPPHPPLEQPVGRQPPDGHYAG
eukprot:1626641-Pyramimonas_sp.AAC.1